MLSHSTSHRDESSRAGGLRRLRDSAVVGVVATSLVGFAALAQAQAADDATWDRVARCESGGNWATDTGNGYHGGLQFNERTWKAHGGKGRAQDAPKAEQIRVAENVLRSQGAGAWPVCGRKAGLTGAGPARRAERSTAKQPDRTRKSVASAPPASGPREEPASSTEQSAPPANTDEIEVRPGDTLSDIAATHHIPGGWQALYAKNLAMVGPDPDLIRPGQRLSLR
ncbi:transglycosylase family protein [Embleya scabrispora]|uniref:LysM peptidoglycan-binding domain-containing protein n=1 Tax=Embleya scabrispora TaxID=159449 RepID=UPI00035D59C5|nr:transglycosylase family protein [Embleya scabrispora]MYS87924.1 LysM peptidoglycan-binding domain-containing protein [Streptomyces sp. SID5474]